MNKKITKHLLSILILVLVGSISFIQFVGAESTVAITTRTISPIISLVSSDTSNVLNRGISNSGVGNNVNLTAGLFSFLGNIIAAIVQVVVAVVEVVIQVVVAVVQTVVNFVSSIISPSSPPPSPPPPSPSSGDKCVSIDSCGVNECWGDQECITNGDSPVYIPPVWTPPVNPPPPPPAPTCQIIEFSLNGKTNEESDPLRVWVGSVIKGLVSTNAFCETCTVESTDTWGNDPDPKVYTMTLNNGYNADEEFKIDTSGTYSFTLTCQGSDPDDIDEDTTSLQVVEAINLPWWQEIIPVLPGF